jgi:catechol 2,3-dioxygenase-like lactoylglutathione lyase family enzyme
MFSHVMVGSNDLERSRVFYDAVLGALGVRPGFQDKHRFFYRSRGVLFSFSTPIDGNPACSANGGTVGFAAEDPAAVDAFHAAGLAAGGTTLEDPPGYRESEFGSFYLAYLRDPDGNKICAMYRPARDG